MSDMESLRKPPTVHQIDVAIIGAGGAGLRAARGLAEADIPVAILSKVPFKLAHTREAQGGIAAQRGTPDSFEIHLQDTVKGGNYLVDADAADILVREAPEVLDDMRELMVRYDLDFDKEEDKVTIRLKTFGGHSQARGHSVGDKTGEALHESILRKLGEIKASREKEGKTPVEFYEEYFVTKLLRVGDQVAGVIAIDTTDYTVHVFQTKAVIMATGGTGQVFAYTSNTEDNTGDGYALALEAGIGVQDMEFIQFHPTGIPVKMGEADQIRLETVAGFRDPRPGFLISEKTRAEGAYLLNSKGERFMDKYDERLELAPRDVVSRAIYVEITEGRGIPLEGETEAKYVHLDMRHIPDLHERTPGAIDSIKAQLGLDAQNDLVPIRPTAHYTMGGIPIDLGTRVVIDEEQRRPDYQQKTLGGLYAAGEAANASVHGANRLGTNSLLEIFVFGRKAATTVGADIGDRDYLELPQDVMTSTREDLDALLAIEGKEEIREVREDLQNLMEQNVGVFRNEEVLAAALSGIESLWKRHENIRPETPEEYRALRELRNMLRVAKVISTSAINRQESRGGHNRVDFKETKEEFRKHTLARISEDGTVTLTYKTVCT
jgi:succinate dehydrogenase / fumarate reductase flavoprotein subunit